MARVDIPLPGKDKDYDSRKSRARLVNLMVQTNQDGSFKSIIKREGTEIFATTTQNDVVVSNLYVGSDTNIYFVGLTNFYRVASTGTVTDLGGHGLTLAASQNLRVISNNKNPDVEYLFNSGGNGVIFDTTLTTITDTDFTGNNPGLGTTLYGRFYFPATSTDTEFFASALQDGFTYDPLAFADAEEEAGKVVDVRSYKSAMWVLKSRNIEYWQTTDDVTFPLRRVLGASQKIGVSTTIPTAQLYDYIGFIGSDSKVYLMTGGEIERVSDIDFAQIFELPEPQDINPSIFFVDGIDHRYLCVTANATFGSPPQFTWCYDLKTRQSHYRTAGSMDFWPYRDGAYSVPNVTLTKPTTLVRSESATGTDDLYTLTASLFDDDGVDFECLLQSASLSFETDVIIEHIEIEMETGVGNADSADPEMVVKYSKDGGVNFFTHSTVKLGGSTDKSNRITLYNFGRLVRHTDFILQLTIEEPVRVEIYGAYANVSGGF